MGLRAVTAHSKCSVIILQATLTSMVRIYDHLFEQPLLWDIWVISKHYNDHLPLIRFSGGYTYMYKNKRWPSQCLDFFVTPVEQEQSSRQLGQPCLVGLRKSELLKEMGMQFSHLWNRVWRSLSRLFWAILSSSEAQVQIPTPCLSEGPRKRGRTALNSCLTLGLLNESEWFPSWAGGLGGRQEAASSQPSSVPLGSQRAISGLRGERLALG